MSEEAIEELKNMFCRHKEESRKDLEESKKDINVLKKEVKYFSTKAEDNGKKLDTYMRKTDELDKYLDCVYIGQMCTKIQECIYQEVLPVYFEQEGEKKPLVKDIQREIDTRCRRGPEKTEAKQKWKDLVEKIGWKPTFIQVMEEFRLKRNEKAHPEPLYDYKLNEIAERLTGQKQLDFKELLEVLKKLRHLQLTFTFV